VPEERRVRARVFLYTNRPTPKEFKNPALPTDRPPALRYPGLAEARAALRRAIQDYQAHFRAHPEATHTHPLFGDLGAEDWERTHYKHCFHHLLQFGLIEQEREMLG
jgi:oxepin-CoA hydrolase/3-oxo-5,6-dehydrosuberyl-CoA semialdehyde dehydrogenase